jgi:cytochrome c-type biogenesis protein CcmH/NrfG
MAHKQWPAARQAAEAACKLEPSRGEAWLLQGQAAIQEGRPGEAVDALRKATQLEPGNAEAHFCLATALWAGKPPRLDEARAEYQAALDRKLNSRMTRAALRAIRAIDQQSVRKGQ